VVDQDINLYALMPLFRVNRGDGGYFIDKAYVISRDPDDWDNDNVENVGVYRLQVKARKSRRHPNRATARYRHPSRPCRGAWHRPAGGESPLATNPSSR
jgi:UbiD family decarboxylase